MDRSVGLPSPRGRLSFRTPCQGCWWQLRSQSHKFQNRSQFSQTLKSLSVHTSRCVPGPGSHL